MFAIQFVREAPKGKWRRANRFLPDWAKRNGLPPDSPKVRRWFANDPRVEKLIEQHGVLGLGLEADRKYFKNKDR